MSSLYISLVDDDVVDDGVVDDDVDDVDVVDDDVAGAGAEGSKFSLHSSILGSDSIPREEEE